MPYDKERYTRLTVAVPKELNQRLETLASKMRMSKTGLIIQMIETNIDMLATTWEAFNKPEIYNTLIELAKTTGDNHVAEELTDFKEKILNNQEKREDISEMLNVVKKKDKKKTK